MEQIPFELTAILGKGTLTQKEFLQLKMGDILVLDRPISTPLDVSIGDTVIAQGRLGNAGNYKAILIEKTT